ncbi:hypothetical protein BDW72DRAFT_212616 [Aspergillus terricola var. indicus]
MVGTVAQALHRGVSTTSRPGLLLIVSKETKKRFLNRRQSAAYGLLGLYRTVTIAETGNLVQVLWRGYDTVCVQACAAREIHISNPPKVVANPNADVAMFMILGTLRHARILRLNSAESRRKGKTLIMRMGEIRQVFTFGMKIICHNRSRVQESKSRKRMKDGTFIINTARELLPDGEAQKRELQTDKLASSCRNKVMLLPHLRTTTVGAKREIELLAFKDSRKQSALGQGELLAPIA